MKFLVVLFFFLFTPLSVFAADAITAFTSDITLNTDGTFDVIENITYDFGDLPGHGIFREIKKQHPQKAASFWKEQYIDLKLQEVLIDGSWAQYDVADTQDQLEIKIGDPDVTVVGKHTYTISYKVAGGYSYFDDGTVEIYWNATGNAWQVPVEHTVVRLHASDVLFVDRKACYVGVLGASASCDHIAFNDGVVEFTQSTLQAGSGLTIAQEISGSAIQKLVYEHIKSTLLLAMFLPILLGTLLFLGYKYRTWYKTGKPIIVQYEPYKDFKPMHAGVVFDGRLDPRDITAGIVYLAQQGYLKITKIDKKVLFLFEVDDYKIDLLRPLSSAESTALYSILLLLFPVSATPNQSVTLSILKDSASQQRSNALRLTVLQKELKSEMKKAGFFQINMYAFPILPGVFLGLLVAFLFMYPLIVGAIGVIGIVLYFLFFERRTRAGYEALDYLKGFKLFLSVTDEERFKFHNAPQKSPEQFMEYLPYAIAFGVEKQWSEVFKDITIPAPTWYEGGNIQTFSAVNLSSSLGAFSTSFVSSAAGSGSRSSSSFGGSGGGGFSGGGGGGGGGGRW